MTERRRPAVLVAVLLASIAGCGTTSTAAHSRARPPASSRPRLVVAVVIDQLPSWLVDRYIDLLSPRGAIRTAKARGVFHHRVRYEYAGTYTAPGHAATYTGAPPADTGISANTFWDRARHTEVAAVFDPSAPVLDTPGAFASPARLRVETVADVLHRDSGGRAKIVTVSMKDRGAILPGGKRPDLAVWYEKRLHGFSTSTYYAPALPPWLRAWATANPVDARLDVWRPRDPSMLAAHAGRDDAPGEQSYEGMGITFPHAVRDARDPYGAFVAMPESTKLLLELAAECARQLDLGSDGDVDLLLVSISGTDYVGHIFGPESWEALDNLITVDEALGAFLEALAARAPIAVAITSDHGVAPIPEGTMGREHGGRRILVADVKTAVDAAIDRELGPGDWVDAYMEAQPFVYLSAEARLPERRDRAVRAAIAALEAIPGIAKAFDVARARVWRDDPDPLKRAVARSIDPEPEGDIFVVSSEYAVIQNDREGTGHGSPWPYDTDVPFLAWGPGVAHVETTEPLEQRRVAATLSAMLNVEAPDHGRAEPLPGVEAPR